MERRASRAALSAVAVLALLLMALSVVSTIAAAQVVDTGAAIAAIDAGEQPTRAAIQRAADANLVASRWFESARYHDDATTALLALGPRRNLAAAERAIRASLSAAPGSAVDWARLAYVYEARGDIARGVRAWQLSVLTGRYAPPLMRARLLLGLRLIARGGDAIRGDLVDQVAIFGHTMPRELAPAARRAGAEALVRGVLQSDPDALAAFNRQTQLIVDRTVAHPNQ